MASRQDPSRVPEFQHTPLSSVVEQRFFNPCNTLYINYLQRSYAFGSVGFRAKKRLIGQLDVNNQNVIVSADWPQKVGRVRAKP
jgi:hypothetical protein